jgi:hypothetical protein
VDEQSLSDEQVFLTYKEQQGVERGFRFLKDPLFLASSVFVKKPERVIALSFIMVLRLLVYRLAEQLLHPAPPQQDKAAFGLGQFDQCQLDAVLLGLSRRGVARMGLVHKGDFDRLAGHLLHGVSQLADLCPVLIRE